MQKTLDQFAIGEQGIVVQVAGEGKEKGAGTLRNINWKKLLLPNIPYFLIGLYATKLGQAWRLSAGTNTSEKLLHIMDGFSAAFQSPFPSFHPRDLLIGLLCGVVLRVAVYVKSKNAKKYRHGSEYGSARWSA